MEGVEIVIKPIHLERLIYSIVIIVLVVLLITHWNGGSSDVDKEAKGNTLTGAGLNQTNQTANVTPTAQPASLCANAIKDQDETDVDCGGSKCTKCTEFKACNVNTDCAAGWCRDNMKCVTPTCEDTVKNQGETDVDCGGPCASTKGAYFYEGACHITPKPQYSGRIDLSIISVGDSVNPSSGFARIDNVKFSVANGKQEDFLGTAYIYVRDSRGMPYFESSISGEEIPIKTLEMPSLLLGQNRTETVNVTKTLPETESTEAYRIVIELRDGDDNLIKEATWTNR
jgi:hypothetical protein